MSKTANKPAALSTDAMQAMIQQVEAHAKSKTAASKTATKGASKTGKTGENKTASKTGRKTEAQTMKAQEKAPQIKAGAIKFGIHNGSRPAAGRLLFAFTHAWLSLSGMAEGKAYSKAQAVKVAGSTAISYHIGNGNIEEKGGAISLTAKGQNFFKARSVDAKACGAYVEALKTGQPQDGISPADKSAFFAL